MPVRVAGHKFTACNNAESDSSAAVAEESCAPLRNNPPFQGGDKGGSMATAVEFAESRNKWP